MTILGISCHYHESAAVLIIDGKIVAAAEEERFSRIKHDATFPIKAIHFCLKEAGLKTSDVDYVAFYEKPLVKFERNITMSMVGYPQSLPFFVDAMKHAFAGKLWIQSAIMDALHVPKEKIVFVPQHLSHAAASFYPSPFQEAAYLTLDAVGEWSCGSWGTAKGHRLSPRAELRFPHSVGLLYSAFTAFLGFEVNDGEYKVMGMAAYGKPRHIAKIKKTFRQFPDGSIQLDMRYFAFAQSNTRMYTRRFEDLFAGCGRFDLARSLQKCVEEIILTMMGAVYKETKQKNLVFGGGVALNSVVNGLIAKKTPFKNVYIFPAAGDDGAAAGAAWYIYHHVLGYKKRHNLKDVFLGQQYSDTSILHALRAKKMRKKKMSNLALVTYVARELALGKVVGWFEGRAEFGPRALGHRSILADPRKAEMKNIVNARIKFREEFRPFAPVVISRVAHKYFAITSEHLTPFMLGTFRANPIAKKKAQAVVHDDRTSRIQTVEPKKYSGLYGKVLEKFYALTRVPVLMNTSFNLKGEPMVNSPEDAISTFMRSGLDILVLGNYVIEKKQ